LFLASLLVGPMEAVCPEGDLVTDCRIDWRDLEFLALLWLAPPGSPADLTGQDGVNLADFATFARNWGATGEPTGSLRVIISPQAALDLGAKWRIIGGDWQLSGNMLLDIPVGSYAIEFTSIDTWIRPAQQIIEVLEDLISDVRVSYKYPVVINEFLASNSGGTRDPQGQDDDWIEMYNSGNQAIDIGGMYLTDNSNNPKKWQIPDAIPEATTIAPNGYLIIWADRDAQDNINAASGLHADFRLDSSGDDISLFDSTGTILIDNIEFPDQDTNISYGRYPDGNDTWQFFPFPTPGYKNIGAYIGQVPDTEFSHDRGFYSDPILVTIACEMEEADIYYTLDGTEPGMVDGGAFTGVPYSVPIPISKTSCLRARAVKTGWKPSNADAQTYVFLNDVISQDYQATIAAGLPNTWGGVSPDYGMDPDIIGTFDIYGNPNGDDHYGGVYAASIRDDLKSVPTLSIAMDTNDLFGPAGIYTNSTSDGVYWERPASVEYFCPDGKEGFQVNCGIRIQGGWFRQHGGTKKHSFRLLFKGIYGPTKLEFPLFGDDAAEAFDTIILRAGANDGYSWSEARYTEQYIRDEFGRNLYHDAGHASPHGAFVHLYLNGVYWGLYNAVERPDHSFSASYYGGEKEDWDSIHDGSVTNGDRTAWDQMISKCQEAATSFEAFQELQGKNPDGTPNPTYPHLLDITNYIDYLIVNLWGGNWDWPWKNWWAGRERSDNSTGFKFYCWDYENTMGNNLSRSPLTKNALNNNFSSAGEPHQSLKLNPEYRQLFGDRVHRLFFNGGIHTPESLIVRYSELAARVERAIVPESARWGDQHHHPPLTLEDWYDRDGNYNDGRAGRDWILDYYLPQRTGIVLEQFSDAGLYPSIDAPVFYINGAFTHGGHVLATDSFSMTAAIGTIFYTVDGSDPRVSAVPQDGPSTTLVSEDAAKRVLVPTGPISDGWKGGAAFDDSLWTDGTPVVPGMMGGVGYDPDFTYYIYISYDVRSRMYNQYSGCYIRIPFSVDAEDLADFDCMTLKVRYDDGFVAYLNGEEMDRANVAGDPQWNSTASNHPDDEAVFFESFDVTDDLDHLRAGENILAIHAVNRERNNPDFLVSAELVAGKSGIPPGSDISPSAIMYTRPTAFSRSTHVKARVKSDSTWSALNEAVYSVGPVKEDLRITEIMYNPADTNDPDDPNAEYIELTNIGTESINLNLVKFTNGIEFTFGDIDLPPNDYILIVRNQTAFYNKYPAFTGLIAGQYTGNLNNAGEIVELQDAVGQTIHNFRYRDNWYDITDGLGFSLTIKDPVNTDPNTYGDKANWRPIAAIDGSPGYDDSSQVPELGSVVINEILAHSHAGDSDWIELHNATAHTINIGGWFISDDADNLSKYEIASGVAIPAYGYRVFYQNQHFGNITDPGCNVPFALSENGETLYLHSGLEGVITGYSEQESFGASQTGISFGRYQKSTGSYNFVAMSQNTPGSANAYPLVGPIVISEIMYNPGDGRDAEYVELVNITDLPVILYDSLTGHPWRFTDDPDNPGVEFFFPTDSPVVVEPGEYILLVKDVSIFNSEFTAPVDTQIFQWGAGRLDNAGEKVQISTPGDVDLQGTRYWIRVDRVNYSDGSHPLGSDPWPTEADGLGLSLSRISLSEYGNDIANWQASIPSPGGPNP
jgi:hypothetical protein